MSARQGRPPVSGPLIGLRVPLPSLRFGRTFQRSTAGVRDHDAGDMDIGFAPPRALKLNHCEPAANEIGNRLKPESAGQQRIHVAAARRLSQHSEHPAMSLPEVLISGLRGHFGPQRRSRSNCSTKSHKIRAARPSLSHPFPNEARPEPPKLAGEAAPTEGRNTAPIGATTGRNHGRESNIAECCGADTPLVEDGKKLAQKARPCATM